jgi:hypothetical protein
MKTKLALFALLVVMAFGCAEKPVDLAEDAKNTPKLSKEEAEKFKDVVPGGRKSQQAAEGK